MNENKTFNLGVVIGRFQVAELTNAHYQLIKTSMDINEMTLILIGCLPKNQTNLTNPLNYEMRKDMIMKTFNNSQWIEIMPIEDANFMAVWCEKVNFLIDAYKRRLESLHNLKANVTLYGGRDSFIEKYNEYNPWFHTEFLDFESNESGTKQREKISKNIINTTDFRKGIIYAKMNNL